MCFVCLCILLTVNTSMSIHTYCPSLFRQLFGGVNHGVGHFGKRDLLSGSMSMSMSMSMMPEWGDSSSTAYVTPPPVPSTTTTTTEPGVILVDYPTLPTADEAEDTPSGEEGSAAVESSGAASATTSETLAETKTGRENAMFGVLSLALVGLVGAVLARRKLLKQRHAGVAAAGQSDTSSSLSPSSDASMMDNDQENGRMMS
jgi:hypothetical protein